MGSFISSIEFIPAAIAITFGIIFGFCEKPTIKYFFVLIFCAILFYAIGFIFNYFIGDFFYSDYIVSGYSRSFYWAMIFVVASVIVVLRLLNQGESER